MKCVFCGKEGEFSKVLPVCPECLRKERGKEFTRKAHERRSIFGLPSEVPKKGLKCELCANECRIPEGAKGFCGLIENRDGVLVKIRGLEAPGFFYYDPLPTNCVAEPVCRERKGYNLAVFYSACNLDCLFCQNWEYREGTLSDPTMDVRTLASAARKAKCVCFFGGDPAPLA